MNSERLWAVTSRRRHGANRTTAYAYDPLSVA